MSVSTFCRRVPAQIGTYLFLSALPLHAAQSEAKGLFFAAGVGVALTQSRFDDTDASWKRDATETHEGLAASFKLGYGFNERLDVYVTRTSSFVHGYDNDTKDRTFGNCITALGMNYRPQPKSPWYVMAAAGQGQLSDISQEDAKAEKGWGYLVGVGYELRKHVHFEASYMGIRVDDKLKVASDSLHLALSIYLY